MNATFKLTLGQRGTITIPKALRTAYHLKPGKSLTLIDLGGVLVLFPEVSQVDQLADQLRAEWEAHGITLAEMLAELQSVRAIQQLRELRQEIENQQGVITTDILTETRQESSEELFPPDPGRDN